MKYCDKCKVNVVGKRKTCPLCQDFLSGQDNDVEDEFPPITFIYKEYNMFFKMMMLISIIIASVSIAVNAVFHKNVYWSLFIIGGLASVWVSLITAINKRNNIPKNIIYQVVIVSIAVVVWDYVTKWKGWSIDYVIPLVYVFAMISMFVISKIMKLKLNDYILYLIIDGIFGIIPIIFILTGVLNVLIPSLICVVSSIISLSTILIFEGESMREEMKRRLHL
ncbi:MAG: DUF6320 domain-containing protein [Tissierellia bacterium]|nr:DUF6320 domain-containing protein [Tissierellia bacterium]